MGKKEKKLVIFNIEKRASVASGHIKGESGVVDNFLKVLTDAMDALDADPVNASLTDEERQDFKNTLQDDDDDHFIVLNGEKKIHTLDDILKK